MCWSASISIFTAFIHLITLLIVKHGNAQYKNSLIIFLGFYMTMEIFQAIQHLTVNLEPIDCDTWNFFTTFIAWNLIWVQPILFNMIIPSRQFFNHDLLLSIVTYIVAILNLVIAAFCHYFKDEYPNYSLPNTNHGIETCTGYGYDNHLQWMFAVKTIQYGPTYYVYLMLMIAAIFKFPFRLFWTIGMGWIFTLFLSLFWVGMDPVLPSVWCFMSVLVDIPIIISLI
jgi:hypothetical protein